MHAKLNRFFPEKKNSKKLRPRTAVYKLPSSADKAIILKNSNRLKGTSNYVNKDFSKETLTYRRKIIEKGECFEQGR